MFGRTSNTNATPSSEAPKDPLSIQGIPTEFYGGANPVIHFKTTTKEVDVSALNSVPRADQKAHTEQTAVGGVDPHHPVHFFSDSKKMLMAVSGVLLLFVVVGGVYYVYSSGGKKNSIAYTPSNIPAVVTVPSSSAPSTEQVPSTSNSTPVARLDRLVFPSLLLGDSQDDDQDLLTNKEEGIYRADPGVSDSDNDTYPDAHELYFLYSPTEKEPSRLINSGNVTEYANSGFGYRLFYPSAWLASAVDPEYRDVLFTSLDGDYVEVRAFDREPGVSFTDWLATIAPDERIDDLSVFETRAVESGLVRQDYLVYYFATNNRFFVMVYHPALGSQEVGFRSTLLMMARSFKSDTPLETISVGKKLRSLGQRTKKFVTIATPQTSEPSNTTTDTGTSVPSKEVTTGTVQTQEVGTSTDSVLLPDSDTTTTGIVSTTTSL